MQRADWLQDFSKEGDINPLVWHELLQEFDEEEELIRAQEEFEGNGEIVPEEDDNVGASVLDYFSEESNKSYDGYYSSSDDWSAVEEEMREKRPQWKDDHIAAHMAYYIDFDKEHPKYCGWVEECDWWKELNRDLPDYPTFKQWRKIKGITLQGIDAVKKCVECVEQIIESDDTPEVYGSDQPDSSEKVESEKIQEKVPEVIQLSSDSSVEEMESQPKRMRLQSPDYKYDDVVMPEEEKSQSLLETEVPVQQDNTIFLSEDEDTTVLGYDVAEFKDHPMIIPIVQDIERSYMYNYNSFVPEGMMYTLVKQEIALQKREPADQLFDQQ